MKMGTYMTATQVAKNFFLTGSMHSSCCLVPLQTHTNYQINEPRDLFSNNLASIEGNQETWLSYKTKLS